MTPSSPSIDQTAMEWLVRVQDPTFDDWDAWESWLTQDPEHANAYWRLAEHDAELGDAPIPALPAAAARRPVPDRRSRPVASRRRLGLGISIAAAVLLACGLAWTTLRNPVTAFETAPGETRSVVLADGTTAHLAGATRLEPAADGREVRLLKGRATFEVADAAGRPFTVLVDEAQIVDLGTVFDVTRFEDGMRVAVSEGLVRYDGSGRSERLEAGEGLIVTGGQVEAMQLEPEEVSSWRENRLSYRQVPLATVGEDLARALGIPVQIPQPLRARRFTGSLDTTGGPATVKPRVELLLGVVVSDDGAGWRLDSAGPL